ncbi:hypothetical protein VE02_08652 [Pseudogymnoascus sp. 03VT05]|nr:hypothetical protein VE02_08652 [Pseudogymnoascus sp. 03VT05]
MLTRKLLSSLSFLAGAAYAANITVSNHGGNSSSPLMYGIMFEDINHSGDGGIYAELIQNRAFQGSTEFPSTIDPWEAVGKAKLTLQNTTVPLSWALPTSVQVAPGNKFASGGTIGLQNPGWWGISVTPQPYSGSFWALGSYHGKFTAKLQSAKSSHVWASVEIKSKCQEGEWVEHEFHLHPRVAAPDTDNIFVLDFKPGQGSLNFNLISLFPPTYKNSPNGNRPGLMAGLKDLNPSFLRMPGGNNLYDSPSPTTKKERSTDYILGKATSLDSAGSGMRPLDHCPSGQDALERGVMQIPMELVSLNTSNGAKILTLNPSWLCVPPTEYARPNIFATQFGLFDNANRSHPILIGEYATIEPNTENTSEPVSWDADEPRLPYLNWVGAVAETIFTLGAERNADIVIGASYAPGFQNINGFQWAPDLVSFSADPAKDVYSTSYYAIQLLSAHRYTHTAPFTSDEGFGPAFYVAGVNQGTNQYTFKATVYNTTSPVPFNIDFEGLHQGAKATLTVLNAPSGLSENVPNGENVVKRTTTSLTAQKGEVFSFQLKEYDIAVLTTF